MCIVCWQSAEVAPKPVTGPTTVPKANSLSRLDQEKPPYRYEECFDFPVCTGETFLVSSLAQEAH